MGCLKKTNKIGGAKYQFLMRCVLLVQRSRTGVHWSRAGVPNTSIAIDRTIAKVAWVDRIALKKKKH